VALSPLVGNRPVSGPAAKLMAACGVPASDEGIATLLGHIDLFVVDKKSDYHGECRRMKTLMRTKNESLAMARGLLDLISCS
jgi:LPPG:FO 2-phospho-L-lactate transferase